MTKRKTFKGTFNLSGQVLTYFTNANCQATAKQNMIIQMSKEVEISRYKLNQIFNGEKDNFAVVRL